MTNLSIKDNALLDFRKLPGNPQLQGDLTGAISSNQSTVETGAIVLRNNQTLEVTGVATGAIRLNDHQRLTWQPLKQNHPYLIANQASTATLIITPKNGQEELGLYVQEEMTEDGLKTYHLEGETSQTFKSFKWNGGETQLINPIAMEEYLFPVQYINEFDEEYIPDDLGNFKLSFIKHSQNDLEVTEDDDMDLSVYFDFDGNIIIAFIYKYPDPDDPNSGELDLKDYEGDLTIKLEHVPTGSVITKMITVLRSQENESIPHLTGSVELSDTLKVGDTLTATTKDLPQDAERLKYRWLVDGQEVYDGTEQTLELKEDYVGKSIQVEVRASNYIGSVSSSEKTVLTNKLQGTVRIEGTPRQGETLQAVVENAQTSQLKYQWLMDDQEISGATSATLELKSEHVGHIISVVVTADDYIEHLSTSTTRVLLPELTGTLTLKGTPKIGETLTAELSGLPAGMQNITYQWFADRTEIPGATASTFVVTKEYSGKTISVEVRDSNYDGRLLSQEVLVLGHLDLNNDGMIDEHDLELLATLYNVTSQDSEWNEKFDLNEDGIIDLYDIVNISTKMNK